MVHPFFQNSGVPEPARQIIRIQASSNYCRIYFNDGRHVLTVAKVLQWFQQQLPAEQFIRIHRSHLVNKNYMSCCLPGAVVLHNGETIGISRRRKKDVKKIA